MCGFIDQLFGGGEKAAAAPAPAVVREAPKVDDAKIQSDAAAEAAQDKTATKRRRRYQSLLATGGSGDPSTATTGIAGASAGKPTLGA